MIKTKTVALYFFGGPNDCIAVKSLKQVPDGARYVCSTEGYNVYDDGDQFYTVEELNKWNK